MRIWWRTLSYVTTSGPQNGPLPTVCSNRCFPLSLIIAGFFFEFCLISHQFPLTNLIFGANSITVAITKPKHQTLVSVASFPPFPPSIYYVRPFCSLKISLCSSVITAIIFEFNSIWLVCVFIRYLFLQSRRLSFFEKKSNLNILECFHLQWQVPGWYGNNIGVSSNSRWSTGFLRGRCAFSSKAFI